MKIILEPKGSGEFEAVFGPIGSNENDIAGRERDFSFLLYDIVYNKDLGLPLLKNVHGVFGKEGVGLMGKMSGNFTTLEALEEKFEIRLKDGRFVYRLADDQKLIRSNGRVDKGDDGSVIISWPQNIKSIEYKVMLTGSGLQPAYRPEYSLLPEYRAHVKKKGYFKNVYIKHKFNFGYQTLKDRDYKAAYRNFQDLLRVDSTNKTAQKEIKELAFVPFLGVAELIPLPKINIFIGAQFTTETFEETIFMDAKPEMGRLKNMLSGADDNEKACLYCKLSTLSANITPEHSESKKYLNQSNGLFAKVADHRSLNAECRYCYCLLLIRNEEYARALDVLRVLAQDHPRFWKAYGQIFGGYLTGSSPMDEDELKYWLTKGDDEVQKYLTGAKRLLADTAFELFKYILGRNRAVMKIQKMDSSQQNIVGKLAYDLLVTAAAKEPGNPTYRGTLGSVQLHLLTFRLFDLINPELTEPHDAVIDALKRLTGNDGGLLAQAEQNLKFAADRLSKEPPLLIQNMAYLEFLKMNFQKAESLYIKAIETKPERDEPYPMLTAFYDVVFPEGKTIREDKRDKLLGLLYQKIKLSPRTLDQFLIGKLEDQKGNHQAALEQFKRLVEKDPNDYPAVVGFFKTRLLTSPREAGAIIREIDDSLTRKYQVDTTAELRFAKAAALVLSDQEEKGVFLLTDLMKDKENRSLEGLREAIDLLSTN
ncbi:tetratricopeptide repeat protein [Thermodesulfobacteriota bacterium]